MSTELVNQLEQQLGVTYEQAEGGAALLLQLAQEKIPADDFLKVADSIPAISDLIGKSPLVEAPPRNEALIWFSRLFGGLGAMTALVGPFEKLEMAKKLIPKFVEIILAYFSAAGGQEVESLLLEVLR